MNQYVCINSLSKKYYNNDVETTALSNVNLTINKGDIVVITGASGAGKTTFLNLLGGMDTPTSGEIFIHNKNIANFNKQELTTYRREDIGFVFQFYNLIPNLSALENVEMACEVAPNPLDARKILSNVGLADKMDSFPAQLSGGQQQRVAIARAIAKRPKLLLCDEPTGALDYESGKAVLRLLQNISQTNDTTIIIITHNQALQAIGNHVIQFKNGGIVNEYFNDTPLSIDEVEY